MATVYDAIVVGSGAAGGWAAKELTERGLSTILLEAGRSLDPKSDFPEPPKHSSPLLTRAAGVLRGQAVQARCMSFSSSTRNLFVNDRQNPYTHPGDQPFNWYRSRQVGGRLHLWGRNAVRISDHEFKAASADGFGANWPIGYADLEPWYRRVESFLGVHGSPAGAANLPDGVYEGALNLTPAETRIVADLKQHWPGRPVTTCRIIRHNQGCIPLPLAAAQATGRLTLRSDAVVSRISVDPSTGLAQGVILVDRVTGVQSEVFGRTVILCASAIESVRILLNSKSAKHPAGIGNSSKQLGRYLTDHVMLVHGGPFDEFDESMKADPYDFGAQSGIFIPSFRNAPVGASEKDFLRGYSMLGSAGRLKFGWFFMAIGEMLPRYENFVELDPDIRDAWGIPVARIQCQHSENEHAMVRDMDASLNELREICGLKGGHLARQGIVNQVVHRIASGMIYTKTGALTPGSAIHESGGACMGADPAHSVLNPFNQCWDAPNILVTDAAAFTTGPYQNPGLTIMALSARAGHFVADRLQKGEL